LSGSLSYLITEAFGWEQGLDKKFHEAKAFYIIVTLSLLLGLSLNYIGISPIKSLNIFSHTLWAYRSGIDCYHSAYFQQQKDNGELYQ
jgi:hypothetical protein